MLNFPVHYKLAFLDDRTGFIASDHENKTLYISKDIKINITNDDKLRATFKKDSADDCSVTVSDPSVFNYCIQKDGKYQLSASNVTFNGTKNDDSIVLNECANSTIDLGKGDDSVTIENSSRPIIFYNNKIKTGNGNDTVTVSGNFKYFCKNEFYLGKGSDTFNAEINPDADAATYHEYAANISKYGKAVCKNEVYAIDGYTPDGDTKGFFENNVFNSKTHCANQLFKYISGGDNMLDGFQKFNYKSEPKQNFIYLPAPKQTVAKKEQTPKQESALERAQRKHDSGAFASQVLDPELVTKDPKAAVKKAKEAAQEYADSFQEFVDAQK